MTPTEKPEEFKETENKMDGEVEKIIVVASGYFDPLHYGHINYLKAAKQLGDILVVIINNDNQTKMKKGFVFMPHDEKAKIISELSFVDKVVVSIDEDGSQCATLEHLKPHIFANGGDRHQGNIPEVEVCNKLNIRMIDNVGGEKIQSSSELIKKTNKNDTS